MKTEEIEMDMPTPCQRCGNIFELNDGRASEKWYPNTIICDSCDSEEEDEIQLDDEIEELKTDIEDAKITIKDNTERLLSLGVKITTTQPQPTMSAEKQMIDFSWWLVKNIGRFSDDMQAHYNGEYLNIWRKSESLELNAIASFTPPRTEQEEADRIFHALGHHKSIAVTEYTIQSLQLRGLSTEFEEKVLTILKGR